MADDDDAPQAFQTRQRSKLEERFLAEKQRRRDAMKARVDPQRPIPAIRVDVLSAPAGATAPALKQGATAPVAAASTSTHDTASGVQTITFTESTNIARIEHTPALAQVVVVFHNGARATFGQFTDADIAAWRAAPSAGRWFFDNVRQNKKGHPVVDVVAPAAVRK